VGTYHAAVEVSLLGPLEVRAEAGSIALPAARLKALLAALALRAGKSVSVAELIGMLWGEDPPRTAVKLVQVYVSQLRASLPEGAISTVGGGYALAIEPEQVDARRFELLLGRVRHLTEERRLNEAAGLLGEALGLWNGRALADVADSPAAAPDAARLEELRRGAEEDLVELHLALGEHHETVADAEAAVKAEPLRECRWAQLMLALYRCGRQGEALRAFTRLRRILGDELGIEPGPDLRALEEAILLQKPELDWHPPPEGIDHDELDSSRTPRGRWENLPAALSSFVGRRVELSEVQDLLQAHRLVTLTGAGGVGKTRLAVEAVRAVVGRWSEGVWLVELAAVSAADAVAVAIGEVLGFRLEPGTPVRTSVLEGLADRHLLLVLDNCEHVLEVCSGLVTEIGRSCPQVHMLATSREPLHVDGEHVLRVAPLAVPSAEVTVEDLIGHDGVELFVERARAQQRSFRIDEENATTVASVCRRLDGIPLALELAAARIGSMSLTELDRRLDRVFDLLSSPRHGYLRHDQTLHATVEWSYRLLSPAARLLLSRLSVFPADWDLEAAESVAAGDALSRDEVRSMVLSLVDKSLVQCDPVHRGGVRYRLLETVRQYAGERLADMGASDELRAAHAATYLALAEQAAPLLDTSEQSRWLSRLDDEHENMGAAMSELLRRKDRAASTAALRLCVGLSRFWYFRGHYQEAIVALSSVLASPPSALPEGPRAAALDALGTMRLMAGDPAAARSLFEEGLELSRRLGDDALTARMLAGLALATQHCDGDESAVRIQVEEAVATARRSESPLALAVALQHRAFVRSRSLSLRPGRASVNMTAEVERIDADLREAVELYSRVGCPLYLATALHNLAFSELSEGNLEQAQLHLQTVLSIVAQHDYVDLLPHVLESLGEIARRRRDHSRAVSYLTDAVIQAYRSNHRVETATILSHFELCLADAGEGHTAAKVRGAVAAQSELLGGIYHETNQDEYEANEGALRETLGDAAYEAAYLEGRIMPLPAVIELIVGRISGPSLSPLPSIELGRSHS
jgi:predicted ATPase/DNA-binding SARP family transcriptional activator